MWHQSSYIIKRGKEAFRVVLDMDWNRCDEMPEPGHARTHTVDTDYFEPFVYWFLHDKTQHYSLPTNGRIFKNGFGRFTIHNPASTCNNDKIQWRCWDMHNSKIFCPVSTTDHWKLLKWSFIFNQVQIETKGRHTPTCSQTRQNADENFAILFFSVVKTKRYH